ncbi:MAG TPA: hypothetical protein VIZ43_13425 [Trebonia sp.]
MSDSKEKSAGGEFGAQVSAISRITVALTARSASDLLAIARRSGLSKTDIVNRAISAYEFLDEQGAEGMELLVRNPKTGETKLIRFL